MCAKDSADTVPQSLDLENAELLCSEMNEEEPSRRDRRWFCDAYLGGHGFECSATESIWNLVMTAAPTETIALVACVPALVKRFYAPEACFTIAQPTVRRAGGVARGAAEHRVIGGTTTALSAPALSEFLQETLRTGVSWLYIYNPSLHAQKNRESN